MLATQRSTRFTDAKIDKASDTLTIDTGVIRLTYKNDGQPFSAGNLDAVVRRGDETVTWHPGDKNAANLGGTLRTLDQIRSAVPLGDGLLSRDGWYVLDDSASGLFTGNWFKARPNDGNTDWYFFGYGHDYKAALKSLTAVGGPVPLPRRYALGLWYSRYWAFTTAAFKQIVDEYDRHGFPLDVMVLDMDWHVVPVPPQFKGKIDTWTGYTWDKSLIPDPAALLAWLHDRGLHVTLNDHPAAGVQPHEEMYAEFNKAMNAEADGHTVPYDAGSKRYLDTNWAFTHTPRQKQGVDFWWLDWQQYPQTRSVPELTNLQVLNWYYFNKTAEDGRRGISFSRWAGWGDHRYPIHFSGDADTGWPMLAFEVPFTSTAGNVGCFFWSHDIGGHQGGRNEESYARWCQFGAFSAALRSHSTKDPTTDRRPWNYADWAEASMRVSFRLRSLFMPYVYTAARQATADSVPFIRPMYLDSPTVEAAYHNAQEYLFGDNLLVAPVTGPGTGPGRVATQAVWFPPGESDWYDYFTGEKFAAGESAVATAPIDQFPLYVRGGVPVPMRAYDHRPATAPLNTLVLRCYPGRDNATGTASLYEDDGTTDAYQRGESATTPLSYTRNGDTITVTVGAAAGRFAGQVQQRAVVIELPDTQPGATADVGTCDYDAAARTTRVTLPAADIGQARVVTIKAAEAPQSEVVASAVEHRLQALLGQPYAAWKTANPKPSSQTARLVAAAQGVAVLPVNPHPYGLGDERNLVYLHNHHAVTETLQGTTGAGPAMAFTLKPGEALPAKNDANPHALRLSHTVELSGLPAGTQPFTIDWPDTLDPKADLALTAVATASTGDARRAADASTDGYPGDQNREWVTGGQRGGAWLNLAWPTPVRVGRVLLYDRPNAADQVLAGTLTFSDGTSVDVGPLPNDGHFPLSVTFPAKTCSWVKFTVNKVAGKTENIGLSEIAVTEQP